MPVVKSQVWIRSRINLNLRASQQKKPVIFSIDLNFFNKAIFGVLSLSRIQNNPFKPMKIYIQKVTTLQKIFGKYGTSKFPENKSHAHDWLNIATSADI